MTSIVFWVILLACNAARAKPNNDIHLVVGEYDSNPGPQFEDFEDLPVSLRSILQTMDERLTKMEQKERDRTDAPNEALNEVKSSISEFMRLINSRDSMRDSLLEILQSEVNDLKAMVDLRIENIDKRVVAIEQLSSGDHNHLQEVNETLTSEMEVHEQQIAQANLENAQLRLEFANVSSVVNDMSEGLKGTKETTQQVKEKIEEIGVNVNGLSSKFDARDAEITNIKEEIDETMTEVREMRCPTGWTQSGIDCFWIGREYMTYSEARKYCNGQSSSELVELTSEALRQKAKSIVSISSNPFWIGAKRTNNILGDWKWETTGQTFTSQEEYWNDGEPNNQTGNEDCVEIYNNGRFNDISCDVLEPKPLCHKQI